MSVTPVRYTDSPIGTSHGLYVFNDVCTPELELELLKIVDELESGDSKREYVRTRTTLHFGHVFNPTTLKVDPNDSTIPIPSEIKQKIAHIFKMIVLKETCEKLEDFPYDQITINRYVCQTRSGIGSHVDTHSVFTNKIISLSLGAPTVMRFELEEDTDTNRHHIRNIENFRLLPRSIDLWVEPRSLIVMSGMSRYLYKHKIPVRKTDPTPEGVTVERNTRTSITIRQVRLDGICDCDYPLMCDYQNPQSLVLPDRVKSKTDNQ
jgi:alkylated DNA repair dioxygenase AlkB